MMKPTIHTNGTARDELLRQLEHAGAALTTAMTALQESAPNGRDYYPQGADAFSKAAAEHTARVSKVRAVRDEIAEIAEAVAG